MKERGCWGGRLVAAKIAASSGCNMAELTVQLVGSNFEQRSEIIWDQIKREFRLKFFKQLEHQRHKCLHAKCKINSPNLTISSKS